MVERFEQSYFGAASVGCCAPALNDEVAGQAIGVTPLGSFPGLSAVERPLVVVAKREESLIFQRQRVRKCRDAAQDFFQAALQAAPCARAVTFQLA